MLNITLEDSHRQKGNRLRGCSIGDIIANNLKGSSVPRLARQLHLAFLSLKPKQFCPV